MRYRRLLAIVTIFLAMAGQAIGFEVRATIRMVDSEKRTATVFANGRERTVRIAANATIQDERGKNLSDGLNAKELTAGATVTITVEPEGGVPTIVSIRLGGAVDTSIRPLQTGQQSVGKSSVGFKPLTEMTAEDRYQGEGGGLYGGGSNDPPAALAVAANTVTAKIQPLDAEGKPAVAGKVVLVSISMSNATQEFSRFKQLADADPSKSPLVSIVDCAQGGQTMARWADPKAACWSEADRRLERENVSRKQVQVAWIKLANAGPGGTLREHGKQLERDTRAVLINLTRYFPNLRIAYLGSRIYGGYADGRLNPEPYAYEGAFVVRWLIQNQANADGDLNYDEGRGEVRSPLLLWGPYFWADGMTPRKSDGLVWERSDFVGDGTHPSDTGRQKVAIQLQRFFKTDPHAKTWFLKQ